MNIMIYGTKKDNISYTILLNRNECDYNKRYQE